ncbi:Enkurin domain-containing protein 1 [Chytriomyces hyalinus]|nr:Enkurin domain-containing protein 1 [Chytriomyces hyalinus]
MLRSSSSATSSKQTTLPPLTSNGLKQHRPGSGASSASAQSKASDAAAICRRNNTEARNIKWRQMSGTAVGMALKPSRGLRDDIVFAGGKPKDHLRENYRRLKDMQKDMKALEIEKAKPPPVPFKMKKFEHVQAKLSTHRPSSASDGASDGSSQYNQSRPSTADSSNRAPSLASHGSTTSSRNYIHLNAIKAKEPKLKQSSSDLSQEVKRSTKMGELPKYLLDRKMEWAEREKERLDALKRECIPKGMKLIPDQERIDTLNFLKDTKQKLLTELSHFALVVESAKLQKRRSALEKKLSEIEEAIGVFSRKKVYVNADVDGDSAAQF